MSVVESAVPERPLLKPWYRRATLPAGLVFEHGRSTVTFGGAAATRLLPVLLPLLDGRRTVPEIVEAVGPAVEPAVANALALLAHHRLLTSGPPPVGARALVRTALGLAQHSGEPPAEVLRRLRGAHISLEGDPALVAEIERLLRRAGLGTALDHSDRPEFVVTAAPAASDPRFARRNAASLASATPWLPVGLFDGATALVGPLVLPGETACYHCLVVRRDAASESALELAGLRHVMAVAVTSPGLTALVAAAALDRILRWVGLRDPILPGSALAIQVAPELRLAAHTVLRVPRCPVCSPSAARSLPSPWHEAAA